MNLLQCLGEAGVKRFVFSSSATVYGDPQSVPIREDAPTGPTNPYGRSKWMIEFMLRDLAAADPQWAIANLRYFNPVGAHESGLIGEDPQGIPNNLMPFISQVAVGRREHLSVFGDDYDTPDGTGVRDYIHVVDLAKGHLAALERPLYRARRIHRQPGHRQRLLGAGHGACVREGQRAQVAYKVGPRRPGDIAACYADPAHAEQLLGWRAEKGVEQMCVDGWRWQSGNPNRFAPLADAAPRHTTTPAWCCADCRHAWPASAGRPVDVRSDQAQRKPGRSLAVPPPDARRAADRVPVDGVQPARDPPAPDDRLDRLGRSSNQCSCMASSADAPKTSAAIGLRRRHARPEPLCAGSPSTSRLRWNP
ncbi:MAG: GDP-mannose 4,6-dehydratase [Burkholderiaceae bacterium]